MAQPVIKQLLDRGNLPDEFTPEFLQRLRPTDLVWLEGQADLTTRQRATFTAWSNARFGSFFEVGKATRQMMEAAESARKMFATFKPPAVFAPRRDPLGDDIRTTVRKLDGLTGRPVEPQLDQASRRHDETMAAMLQLMHQLVARTEEQDRANRRQKAANYFLACVAGASVSATFATIQSSERLWFALIATMAFVGVLYCLMYDGGSSGNAGSS